MPDAPEDDIRNKLIGFGETSIHKSYFPQLHKRLEELELFHVLLDRAKDPIFLVDSKSAVVLEANQAAYNLLGLSKVDQVWKSFLDLFEVARHIPFHEGLGAVVDGETHEVVHVSPSGRQVFFELTLSTMTVSGHRYTVGVARDVTARKQAEDALRESERALRTLFETAPVGIYTATAGGRYLASNPAHAAIHGYASPEALLAEVRDLALDIYADPAQREELLRQLRRDGAVKNFESLHKKRDGSPVWVSTSARLSRDPATGEEHVDGFSTDCTDARRAAKELEASEEKFRSIVESSPTAMYFYRLEADGRLVLTGANPAADSVMGFAHQPLLGLSLEAVFPSLAATRIPDLYRQVALGEIGAQSYQSAYRDERLSAQHDVRVFRTGPGTIAVDILDITERVRLQEMMIQSEKMASVGGLAAGMAHEINNPLSSILQAAQVSLMQLDPSLPANQSAADACGCPIVNVRCYLEKRRVLKFLEGIQEAGKRAAQIVSSMLEFSRKSESRRAMADINAILDKSVELASTDYDLKKQYDFRHIAIVREYDPGLPEVNCTRTEIEQVLLNLLKNAAQAMAGQATGEGGPTITLRTSRIGDSVHIEVADNGPGMTEATRRRVFEPFFTTKEPGQGTGLGLSVSYFIITANHGGAIRVESEPGKGATFLIDLPLGGGPTPAPAAAPGGGR